MDKNTILRKYTYLIEKFEKVKSLLKKYESEKDEELKETMYYALQRLIEEVLESCIKLNIFILKEHQIFPKSYIESFKKLKNIIDIEDSNIDKLASFAKFRNILAHEYQDLSEKITIEKIHEIVEYLPEYIKKLKKLFSS